MRLGILSSHPIQYQAPWFRALAKVADVEVFFAHRQTAVEQGKAGFGVAFDWDVDLLTGYKHRFLENRSARPSVDRFSGCDTPEIAAIISGFGAPESDVRRSFHAFIVMGWYLKSYLQALQACRLARVPVLVRGDSQLHTPRSWWKYWLKEAFYRPLLRRFDGFLVVGRRNRDYLAHYGVPPAKMFFAPHFVDNDWFAARASEAHPASALRSKWGADGQSLVALFVGKLITKKRPADLLQALAKARISLKDRVQRVPDYETAEPGRAPILNLHGVFVGSGELGRTLRQEAIELEVPAHFAGFKNQSELAHYYVAADVLVLPSDAGETWGLVVNEAMACGLPAIVSESVGSAPDLIEEGKTGFTFPCGDSQALADCLLALAKLKLANHNFRPALAKKMRNYSVTTAVSGTLQAVTACMERCREAGP